MRTAFSLLAVMAAAHAQPAALRDPTFVLPSERGALTIYASSRAPVLRAAQDLAADIGRVCGTTPAVVTDRPQKATAVIIVGVIGETPDIDALAKSGQLHVEGLSGQWESWRRTSVTAPWDGVDRALVIAGSDDRGAIYGAYHVSEEIGVSPWFWWADVPVVHRSGLSVPASVTQGPPAVKYRGIFLNDEDWGLRPWAARTLDRSVGNIGPNTYAHIFELLLRLGANTCWPAMHPGSTAFNAFPENRDLAARYGIVMGSSHCEQMLRNNVAEWPHDRADDYNYRTNRDGVLRYWEERVRANGRYENMYTLGMRGVHDGEMAGGGTVAEKAALLQEIISDQRQLLERWVNPQVAAIPQIFCPYKEVLEIYRQMTGLPGDVTLVWPDDNFGYIRRFPSAVEKMRPGGSGLYYHLSYWGSPYDYLWLGSTAPALLHEELSKAWAGDVRSVWIANVGDLKPAEYLMEYFLRLARSSPTAPASDGQSFLEAVFRRDFGPAHAAELASVMGEYYRLNFVRRPEHVGLDARSKPLARPVFSGRLGHDEVETRLEAWQALRARVKKLGDEIPREQRDAFFELVGYPVEAAALMNDKWLSLQRSADFERQGRAAAADWWERARQAHAEIKRLTSLYNHAIAGGKWDGMMCDTPHDKAVFDLPVQPRPGVFPRAAWAVLLEGSDQPIRGAAPNASAALPPFSAMARNTRSIDIFMQGAPRMPWQATATQSWILLSHDHGVGDGRISVTIDWDRANALALTQGSIRITSGPETVTIEVSTVASPFRDHVPQGAAVESDRRITFAARQGVPGPNPDGGWRRLAGLGYSNEAVAAGTAAVAARQPLEFAFWCENAGEWTLRIRLLPTWPSDEQRGQQFAVSFDDGPTETLSLPTYRGEQDPQWQVDVLRNSTVVSTRHRIAAPGRHHVRIWPLTEGLVFDQMLLEGPGAGVTPYLWGRAARFTR